ncbi:Protein-glutamine gamma-glutamyltransferase [Phycisphaerales bacterium]|nr:Protein-glutamine gamma-glutamyltransferase [Phycisphaerales bacterium]
MSGLLAPTVGNEVRARSRRSTFEGRFRVLLLAVVVLSVLAFGVSEGDAGLTITLMSAAIVGWVLTETGSRRGVPRWATVLVLLGILIGAVVRSLQGTPMVSAFSTFLASIIVLKLWEKREIRDYGQLLTLSLFLIIGAALTATTVWIGATLLALTPLVALGVMMYQVYAARERARPAWAEAATFGPLSWERTGRGLAGMTAFAVVAGSAIGVVVFVTVPRGEGILPGWVPRSVAVGRETGFTDRVDLGQGGLISESQATVMEVELRPSITGPRIGGPGQRQYLRGLVLEDYSDGAWTRADHAQGLEHEERETGQILLLGRVQSGETTIVQTVTLREPALAPAPVFGLSRMVDLEFIPAGRQSRLTVKLRIDRSTECVTHQEETSLRVRYRVRSRVERGAIDEGGWERAAVMFPSQRIGTLARTLLAEADVEPDPALRDPADDARAARVFESHLRSAFAYTLASEAPAAGKDPTEWFLLTVRRGHCEHFASGFVALCRSVGIEARVVAGYLASEFDGERGVYVVRQSNAHAWAEVRTGPDRWTTFDATPPAELERILEQQRGWSGLMGRLTDSLENVWNSRVAMFDSMAQERLFGRRSGSRSWGNGVVEWARSLVRSSVEEAESGSHGWWIAVAWIVGGLGGAAGLVLVIRRRRQAMHARAWGVEGEAARLHVALDRAIERRRGRRPAWIPLARWAQAEGPDAQHAAELVYGWAFGGEAPSPAALSRAQRTLRALRA